MVQGRINAFTNPGCKFMVKDDCRKHANTKRHRSVSEARKSAPHFQKTVATLHHKEEETIQAAMKNVYFLAKKNQPNSCFSDLNWLLIMHGCNNLRALQVDGHTSYEHTDSVHDFQNSLKVVVDEQIVSDLCRAEYFAVLIDEMSDVSMDKTMIIYLRYLLDGKLVVKFFEVVGLSGCSANDIYTVLIDLLSSKGIQIKNMFAAGTDGASVMVGKHAGVTTKLKKSINPYLVSVHCIAHRLALASSQAAHKVNRIDKFELRLNQIFNYFHYSTRHMSKLKQIYQVTGSSLRRNFVRPCDTRWLSVQGAVEGVLANLKAMFECLHTDAESGESTARGMLNEMASFDFLAILHLMADVLYYLGQLSCTFQKTCLDLSLVDGHVKAVVNVIRNMKNDAGRRLKKFLCSLPETPSEVLYMKFSGSDINGDAEYVTQLNSGENGIIIKDNTNLRKWFQSCKSQFLDNLVQNLETRFPESNFLKAFQILVPANLPKTSTPEYKVYGSDEIETLCTFYGLPKSTDDGTEYKPVIDPDQLKDEWPIVREILGNNYTRCSFQETWASLLGPEACFQTMYPNMAKIAKIGLIIPVNTADCERGFSRYNLIKTKGRARLKVSSVSALMAIALNTPPLREMMSFNFARAFEIWCCMKQRRILKFSKSATCQPVDVNDLMTQLIDNVKKLAKLDMWIQCDGDDNDEG